MNNSKIVVDTVGLEIETPLDTTPILREQATRLGKIIEAFDRISESSYWKVLEEEVFRGVLESLQRRMRNEKDPTELFRLQGQEMWAAKYCDFSHLGDGFRTELKNITDKLHG